MSKPDNHYAVFGGTFDPVHSGHISVVRFLLGKFPKIVIAPTSANPWKDPPLADFHTRLEMLSLLLKYEGIPFSTDIANQGVILSNYPYVYSKDLAHWLKMHLGPDLHWAVGEDSQESVKKWKDWDSLSITLEVVPITVDVHSEEIRTGKTSVHPALSEFTAGKGLYRPN